MARNKDRRTPRCLWKITHNKEATMNKKTVAIALIGAGILGVAGVTAFILYAPNQWEISFRGWLRGLILRG